VPQTIAKVLNHGGWGVRLKCVHLNPVTSYGQRFPKRHSCSLMQHRPLPSGIIPHTLRVRMWGIYEGQGSPPRKSIIGS
jgi:hypothetical protein